MANKYQSGLDRQGANHLPLTPISLLERTARIYPSKVAVVDDDMSLTYRAFHTRCRCMASALRHLGVKAADTVSIMAFNGHELLESHYAVPMLGAVLNALSTRLDVGSLRYILEHAETKVLLYDTAFEPLVRDAIQTLDSPPLLVSIERGGPSDGLAPYAYEQMLASGDPDFTGPAIEDEWDALALNYTSGTTGNPKGVVYHHRGAYLAAMSNAMAFNMTPRTVFLWTLPMFHCNGWCYTWAVTAIGGTHICLRKVEAAEVLERIRHHHVTHMCGAPVVLNMLLGDFHAQDVALAEPVQFGLGGAAPPSSVISRAQKIGFDIIHLYGLTETYGPSMLCVWQDSWCGLSADELALKMARQGMSNFAINDIRVRDLGSGEPVPADARTIGEIMLRGNTLMKGYLKEEKITREAFDGGWFHTGDLAVVHPDGYVEIKDRAKDIIISGGENISSQEVEEVLYRHPMVYEAAVVALPDEKWGEVPCAFVCLKDKAAPITEAELIDFCRSGMARYKAPKKIIFCELPKTATGKIRKNILRERLLK